MRIYIGQNENKLVRKFTAGEMETQKELWFGIIPESPDEPIRVKHVINKLLEETKEE